jgi:hypothetical protein
MVYTYQIAAYDAAERDAKPKRRPKSASVAYFVACLTVRVDPFLESNQQSL